MKEIKVEKYLKYTFTPAEMEEMSKALARTVQDAVALEGRKTMAVAAFKADIEEKTGKVKSLARMVNDGHEYRNIECEVKLHTPQKGYKTITRKDTGEVVEEVAMTDQEKQEQLPFKDAKTNGKAASAGA